MTSSSESPSKELAEAILSHPQYRDVLLALNHRKRMVEAMARHAQSQGLDATEEKVNRHYVWFLRWYEGVIATGYLMNRTGVKRKQVNK